MEEYTKKGLSTDQNTFLSEKWGKVTFVPASDGSVKNTCRHCILWDNKWRTCSDKTAPCCAWERDDMKNGYFTIHEMPKEKKNGIQ